MSIDRNRSLKSRIGIALLDQTRVLKACVQRSSDARMAPWMLLKNRTDELEIGPDRRGAKTLRDGTSALVAVEHAPKLGLLLVKRMLADWPVELGRSMLGSDQAPTPRVSFVIPHRGTSRLSHLELTLRSLASQRGVPYEVIVVEQDVDPMLDMKLPAGVRYCHDPIPTADALFNRSSALNAGVAAARGDIVVLHDGDFVVPADYALEICRVIDEGYDVVNLKRFVAYLDEPSTKRVFANGSFTGDEVAEELIANLCGGGSVAITKKGFDAIGGMDSAFVGWGGEDEEFWDRCSTLKVWNWAYLPIVHLWHPSQPGKRAIAGRGLHTASYFEQRMAIPATERIAELIAANQGLPSEKIAPDN